MTGFVYQESIRRELRGRAGIAVLASVLEVSRSLEKHSDTCSSTLARAFCIVERFSRPFISVTDHKACCVIFAETC